MSLVEINNWFQDQIKSNQIEIEKERRGTILQTILALLINTNIIIPNWNIMVLDGI